MSEPGFTYTVGEIIKIKSGSFADFIGKIEEVEEKKAVLKVVCIVFGNETPVELNFSQVEKVNFTGE